MVSGTSLPTIQSYKVKNIDDAAMTLAALIKRYIQNTLRQTGIGFLKIVRLYCQPNFLVQFLLVQFLAGLLVWQLLFWVEQNTSVSNFRKMEPVTV